MRASYVAPVVERDSMLYWLAEAAQQARELADRKMVHVAASADMDQSSIWRFEKRMAWPRDPDVVVAAYADDLDVESIALWEAALNLWREDRAKTPDPISSAGDTGLASGAKQAGTALRGGSSRPKRAVPKRSQTRSRKA